jgi:hypothetical protein
MALLIMTIGLPAAFAAPGEIPDSVNPEGIVGTASLDPPGGVAPIFFGNGGYSADGCGTISTVCPLQADVPAGSTVDKAFLYAVTYNEIGPTVDVNFDGTVVTLTKLAQNTNSFLDSYRADVTAQVAAKVGSGGGITIFNVDELTNNVSIDGTALVVTFSNPGEKETSVILLDGGLESSGAQTIVGLAGPLDKTVPNFEATLALGISFGFQTGLPEDHICGGGQFSLVDINGARIASCAGNYDDSIDGANTNNGQLITVGGVDDSTNNPVDPFATNSGFDDELYDIESFLTQGDTQIVIDTVNPSGDDNIFLAVIALNAKASLEICNDGIDNDLDGLVDLADPDCQVEPKPPVVGGEFLPIDSTVLILAGAQSTSWMIPVVLSVLGIGLFVVSRKPENS